MAQNIRTLTLCREKSLFFDGTHPGSDLESFARLAIRSNRIMCQLNIDGRVRQFVVRGHNIPTTLRLTGQLVNAFRANRGALDGDSAMDWQAIYDTVLSDYERTFVPDTWATAYIDGNLLFSSRMVEPILDLLEAEAKGDEITDSLLKRLAPKLVDVRQTRLHHESRAAVVINETHDGMRCAIIERRRSKDSAFSFRVQNPPKQRVRMSAVLFMAADLFEIQNLYALADRLACARAAAENAHPPEISFNHMEAINTRNLQVSALIKASHESYNIHYQLGPPAYLPASIRV